MKQAGIIHRNNVTVQGSGPQTLLLAHGFGCDQTTWRFLIPLLEAEYTLVMFDYVGSGKSDLSAFDSAHYQTLEGYARDVIEICEALELRDVILVGHSVSATIALLASQARPELFRCLVMLSPSPCFLNRPPDYFGGFEHQDLQDLIDLMDKNYMGWASMLAPLVMGTEASDLMIEEQATLFCATDPTAAKVFANATFFADYRHILPEAAHPALILQSRIDALADVEVGRYTHARMPDSRLSIIDAEGHSLHMTHPLAVKQALTDFLSEHNG